MINQKIIENIAAARWVTKPFYEALVTVKDHEIAKIAPTANGYGWVAVGTTGSAATKTAAKIAAAETAQRFIVDLGAPVSLIRIDRNGNLERH